MTVHELISALQAFNPDAQVVLVSDLHHLAMTDEPLPVEVFDGADYPFAYAFARRDLTGMVVLT